MKKDNKTKDELDILIESMKAENSIPDKDFEENFKYELLKKSGKKFSTSKGFLGIRWNFGLAVILLLFIATGIIGVQTISYIFRDRPATDKVVSKELTKEKQVEVLNNFVEKNPEVVITSQSNTIAPTGANVESGADIATQPSLSEKKDIILSSKTETTFTRTVGTLELGESSDLCTPLVSDGVFTSEHIQYIDPEDATYYFKSTKVVEDNIESYYLLNSENYITYHGGKYAVFESVGVTEEDTEPEVGATVEYVDDYLPQDTEVNESEETYQIQNSFQTNCGTEVEEDWRTIIYVYVVSNSDYTIQSTAYYLDEIDEKNLISILTYETTNESHTIEELAQLFEFEYDVELRDIHEFTYTYQERHDDLIEKLSADQAKLIKVNEESSDLYHLTYSGLDDSENLFKYMYDRDFYSDNEFGQKIYDRQIEATTIDELETLYSYSFIDELTSLQFDISYFELENTNEEIIDFLVHEPLEAEEVTITIDGEEITANLYKIDFRYFLIFEFDDYKVVLNYYQFDEENLIDLEDIKFGVWDLFDTEQLEEIDEILREHFKGVEDEIFGLGGC